MGQNILKGRGGEVEVGRELEGGQSGIYEQRKFQFTGYAGPECVESDPLHHTVCACVCVTLCHTVSQQHTPVRVWHLCADDV